MPTANGLSDHSSSPRLADSPLTGRDGYPYFPHPDLLAAANAALAVQMPLLLTGEAGCGKTDFAAAAARGLQGQPAAGERTGELLECYVRSDSRARDLLYHYDAIRRFGDAQHGGKEGVRRAEEPHQYLRLQPLGQALMAPCLRVVLIDEIDKAPRDLPNDLLRELDQGHFEIREIPAGEEQLELAGQSLINADDPKTYRHHMVCPDRRIKPFVIITSNVERQLPDPFLRRRVFFHIPFPAAGELGQILRSRFGEEEGPWLDRVIDVFQALRAVPSLTKKPATSELIHWVQALVSLHGAAAVLEQLNRFAGGSEVRARDRKWSELPWRTLPLPGCLVKLREDMARLEAGA